MGYERHHAIVVTGHNEEIVKKARAKAVEIFGGHQVSEVVTSTINPWFSFFVGPDGSKEGWDESDVGDEQRRLLKLHLQTYRYEDGSSPLAWIEVQYGDDNRDTKVVDDSDAPTRSDKPAIADLDADSERRAALVLRGFMEGRSQNREDVDAAIDIALAVLDRPASSLTAGERTLFLQVFAKGFSLSDAAAGWAMVQRARNTAALERDDEIGKQALVVLREALR